MNLGDKIRQLREDTGLTQGQLASGSSVSQGYLSQLENGEVKNPSAAVLLRVAQAIKIDPDELFEAAGYPTVRTLKEIYQGYESTIEAGLLQYLAHLPRDRQRRLLLLLEGMEPVLGEQDSGTSSASTAERSLVPVFGLILSSSPAKKRAEAAYLRVSPSARSRCRSSLPDSMARKTLDPRSSTTSATDSATGSLWRVTKASRVIRMANSTANTPGMAARSRRGIRPLRTLRVVIQK